MLTFWLSLVMATAGCAGLILAGRGRWYGWAVGLAVQPVWFAFGILTKGYGLCLTAFMYGGVYAVNLWKWVQRDRDAKRAAAPAEARV